MQNERKKYKHLQLLIVTIATIIMGLSKSGYIRKNIVGFARMYLEQTYPHAVENQDLYRKLVCDEYKDFATDDVGSLLEQVLTTQSVCGSKVLEELVDIFSVKFPSADRIEYLLTFLMEHGIPNKANLDMQFGLIFNDYEISSESAELNNLNSDAGPSIDTKIAGLVERFFYAIKVESDFERATALAEMLINTFFGSAKKNKLTNPCMLKRFDLIGQEMNFRITKHDIISYLLMEMKDEQVCPRMSSILGSLLKLWQITSFKTRVGFKLITEALANLSQPDAVDTHFVPPTEEDIQKLKSCCIKFRSLPFPPWGFNYVNPQRKNEELAENEQLHTLYPFHYNVSDVIPFPENSHLSEEIECDSVAYIRSLKNLSKKWEKLIEMLQPNAKIRHPEVAKKIELLLKTGNLFKSDNRTADRLIKRDFVTRLMANSSTQVVDCFNTRLNGQSITTKKMNKSVFRFLVWHEITKIVFKDEPQIQVGDIGISKNQTELLRPRYKVKGDGVKSFKEFSNFLFLINDPDAMAMFVTICLYQRMTEMKSDVSTVGLFRDECGNFVCFFTGSIKPEVCIESMAWGPYEKVTDFRAGNSKTQQQFQQSWDKVLSRGHANINRIVEQMKHSKELTKLLKDNCEFNFIDMVEENWEKMTKSKCEGELEAEPMEIC